MLKHKVDIGGTEMQRTKCDVLEEFPLEEFPPTPEPKEKTIGTSSQEQEVIDITDT